MVMKPDWRVGPHAGSYRDKNMTTVETKVIRKTAPLCRNCDDTGMMNPCSEAAARGLPMGFRCDCAAGRERVR